VSLIRLYNQSAAALPDATVVTNNRFEIVWANDAANRYLGIRGARDAGQRIDNLVRMPEFHEYVVNFDPDKEIEFRSARDVSQRVMLRETRQAFVANASHELKTPLTVVNGYLEMLVDDESLSADVRRQLRTAERHAQRMSDIVSDLLTLSRLENQEPDAKKMEQLPVAKPLHQPLPKRRSAYPVKYHHQG